MYIAAVRGVVAMNIFNVPILGMHFSQMIFRAEFMQYLDSYMERWGVSDREPFRVIKTVGSDRKRWEVTRSGGE